LNFIRQQPPPSFDCLQKYECFPPTLYDHFALIFSPSNMLYIDTILRYLAISIYIKNNKSWQQYMQYDVAYKNSFECYKSDILMSVTFTLGVIDKAFQHLFNKQNQCDK
jgi:hypothetical protein